LVVADIFISYSQQDRDEARLIAAFLEAEGYSVWWDTSLLSGENFRKAIMTELGRARAAIVLWSESSVHSDWMQSEAGRVHADRKLIPVKARSISYKDIPPPFDNMHIGNAADREKILAAITAQLAKPQEQASDLSHFAKKTRFELLSWFGILGAVVTLTTNLQSVLTLARWARQFLAGWTSAITYAWQYALFFLPKVYTSDAVVLTLAGFAIVNMIASSARHAPETSKSRTIRSMRVVSIVIASAILWIVLYSGFAKAIMDELRAGGPDFLGAGYYVYAWTEVVFSLRASIGGGTTLIVILILMMLVFSFVIPLLPAAVVYLLLRTTTSFRLSGAALSARLWRVVAGICLLVALNYLSLWIEQQPWAASWSR
jgi:TIR domain-containing protein